VNDEGYLVSEESIARDMYHAWAREMDDAEVFDIKHCPHCDYVLPREWRQPWSALTTNQQQVWLRLADRAWREYARELGVSA
jgi:hypothetical protein